MLLVLAFTAEDRPLIERIYLSKSPALRKLAYRYLKDEQAAADVVQQSALDFMEIFHTLTYVSESKLCGYLYIITKNNIFDVLGKNGRVSAEVMYRKISELPPRYGAYIQMAYLDKLDPAIIAKVLKVKQDSLRMLGYRARKMLAELCQAESEV